LSGIVFRSSAYETPGGTHRHGQSCPSARAPRPAAGGRTPADRASLERLAVRYPALAAVEIQVTLLLTAVLPAADGAIATEARLDALLESVVTRVVAWSGQTRSDPRTRLKEAVDPAGSRRGTRRNGRGRGW
jgi:hypothetical protein